MEDQCSSLCWGYYSYPDEGFEELKQALLYTTLELETTIISAKEEITKREFEITHLHEILSKTIKERDEAQTNCQKIISYHHHQQQQQQHQHQGSSCSNKETTEPNIEDVSTDQMSPETESMSFPRDIFELDPKRPLPKQGKLLEAVMEAGPLLHTLLLAGPLPRWQHPPPRLDIIEIPPVDILQIKHQSSFHGCLSKKRKTEVCGLPESKVQKLVGV